MGRPAGRLLRWCWRATVWLVLAGLSLSLLAWLTFYWGILPRLDDWRPRLEALASERIGVAVEIGRLEARSSGWVPAFTLHDVVLRDGQGRESLRLPQVAAALSVPSLLSLRPSFAQLLIDGARLEVRRTVQGRWLVAGLDMAGAGPVVDSSAAADWLFEQGEFIIRGGRLRWVDDLRGAPPLELQDVQLVLRNQLRRHALRLDATPPPAWGERFRIVMQARQPLVTRQGLTRAGDWRQWSGTVFAEFPHADASRLRRHVDLPVDLQQGRGSFRAWLDWERVEPRALTLDARLERVRLKLGRDLAPLDLTDAAVRITAERLPDGVKLALDGLQFGLPSGRRWAPSGLSLQWQWAGDASDRSASGPVAVRAWPGVGGRLTADRLDLALLANLAERLPLGVGVRRLLAQLQPEGRVQGFEASWQGPLDAPARWQARGSADGMSMAAAESPEPAGIGRPGWRGAELKWNASQEGGQAELKLNDGEMTFPGVFEQPKVALKLLAAQLQWKVVPQAGSPARIELKIDQASFFNDDAQGALQATWHSGAGIGFGKGGRLPGVLAMEGRLSQGRAASVARYLPLGIPADVRQWARQAVQSGEVHDVAFRVKGDLWEFPYLNRQEGEFRVLGHVRDMTLAAVPSLPASGGHPAWTSPWPAFEQVSAEFQFERDSMQFRQARGRLWGLDLADVQGRIRELSPKAVLEIQGRAIGSADEMHRYVRATPIDEWSGHALEHASFKGPAELKLALNLPLARAQDTSVQAELQLQGNDIRWRPELPLLAGARGQVDITHRGLQLRGVRAQWLGGEARIDGGMQADGSMRYQVAGLASAEGMRRAVEWPGLVKVAQPFTGQASYRLQLGFRAGQGYPEITLSSSLEGLAIDLPEPIGKTADLARPFLLTTLLQPPVAGAGERDLVRLELGALQAVVLRDLRTDPPLVLRSALAHGAAVPEPVAGGRAVLRLPRLDVDAWRSWLQRHAGPAGRSDRGLPLEAWVPHSIQLQTPELLAMGRRLTGFSAELQRQPGPAEPAWRAQVRADQTQGSIEFRDPRPGQDGGRLRARLTHLVLPPAEAEHVSDLLDDAPASVPALDVEVEQFELRGRLLGRLLMQATNQPASSGGAGRTEWRLDNLQLRNADGHLQAKGMWQASAQGRARRVELDFKLGIDDGGKLLERLGFGRVVQGSRGQLAGHIGWEGSPLSLHIPSLTGAFKLQMGNGQFLKADAGAARLLGVLSLQALPRRLVLDFRDLFEEGFAFDDVSGDLRVERGVASTNNLRMRGLQAAVLLEGSADIARETQDLHAVVLPELNTASASLAYAVINPAVGLGAWLGQWLLREPLRQASAREFRISGSWTEPQVTRIERRLTDPLPPHAAAASDSAAAAAAEAAASAAATSPLRPGP